MTDYEAIARQFGVTVEKSPGGAIRFHRDDLFLEFTPDSFMPIHLLRAELEKVFGPTTMTQSEQAVNFANHPKSITELKADRDGCSSTWEPRDALVNLLRDIDSGSAKPTDLVICYVERNDDGTTLCRYLNATKDLPTALGVISRVQWRLNTGETA